MYCAYDEDEALGAEASVSLQFHGEHIDIGHAEQMEREQRGWMSDHALGSWGEVPIMDPDEEIDDAARDAIRDIRFG
jgi:hypothetical protein